MLRFVQSLTDHPVAVITNGSLLHLPRVRADLLSADAVLPSLDAGTDDLYRRINRPRRELSFDQHVRGLTEFRRIYKGKLWVEVMLLGGVNDSEEALRDLAEVLAKVEPDEIHIGTPTRPPAETWVKPPDSEGIERAASILGRVATVLEPVTVHRVPSIDGDLGEAVLGIIHRHPLDDAEIERILTHWAQVQVDNALEALATGGRIQIVERFGRRFWCAADLDFPRRLTPRNGSSNVFSRSSEPPRLRV
jgi:wyosine [tRNA(Phe)-imidazoG37] synthetase (radical SAM superfamily)